MTSVSNETTNALELSDEEFANLDFDSLVIEDSQETKEDDNSKTEIQEDSIEEAEGSSDNEHEDEDEVDTADESENEDTESTELEDDQVDEETDSEKAEDTTESEEKDSESEETEKETPSEIDYKAAYEELFSPFKANGREIKVDSVADAKQLMQMGANYNKKMAAIKPHLKLLKMLENNDLLKEEKLNYLIDLDKKNPEAINKLVKDSGVDPLNIDVEAPSDYKPNTYTVDDKSVELDGILDDIRDTKSFNETLDIVGNKWDNASKRIITENPNILKILNDHVESGIYSQIQQVVENERMFGRLNGLSDLEAYKQVGDQINAKGGFTKSKQPPKSKLTRPANKTNKVDPKLKSRKKVASSTKSVASSKTNENFNPLSMSDEEFEKIAASKYM